jgi:hypothetical protein
MIISLDFSAAESHGSAASNSHSFGPIALNQPENDVVIPVEFPAKVSRPSSKGRQGQSAYRAPAPIEATEKKGSLSSAFRSSSKAAETKRGNQTGPAAERHKIVDSGLRHTTSEFFPEVA